MDLVNTKYVNEMYYDIEANQVMIEEISRI